LLWGKVLERILHREVLWLVVGRVKVPGLEALVVVLALTRLVPLVLIVATWLVVALLGVEVLRGTLKVMLVNAFLLAVRGLFK